MQTIQSSSKKPVTQVFLPNLTRLPELSNRRLFIRKAIRMLAKCVIHCFACINLKGLEYLPQKGPAIVVSNHLGDADVVVGLAKYPDLTVAFAKIELFALPIIGMLMDWYGVIWVHRGKPDRRALKAAITGLKEGRIIAIAPEGRESLTGALEEGTHGASYLATKMNVPIIPITFTGTENRNVWTKFKHLRRVDITMTIGSPFYLKNSKELRTSIRKGTDQIMNALASQLPAEYRGFYQ